jgi:hypothetical protein
MREMTVTEQRYQAVLAVIAEGRAVMEVASSGAGADGRFTVNDQYAPR